MVVGVAVVAQQHRVPVVQAVTQSTGRDAWGGGEEGAHPGLGTAQGWSSSSGSIGCIDSWASWDEDEGQGEGGGVEPPLAGGSRGCTGRPSEGGDPKGP